MQRKFYITTIIFLFLFSVTLFAQSVGNMYQDGLHKEETLGDLNAAIESYSKAVEMQQQNRQIAAQAQLRIGLCYEKLGKDTEAKAAFQKVLKMFVEQEEVVQIARKHIQRASQRHALLSDGHPYFPLSVGNRWVYDFSKGRTVEERTMELISSQEDAEGTTWYRCGDSPWKDAVVDWGLKDNGLFLRVEQSSKSDIVPMLTSPIESGRKWEFKLASDETLGINFQILSAKEKVTTPAGTFEEVVKLQFEIPEDETDYFYFAKDVGLIKLTGPHGIWELREYTLVPKPGQLKMNLMDLKPPQPGSFVWFENIFTGAPEPEEPEPPETVGLVSIVVQRHEDGSFDTIGCSLGHSERLFPQKVDAKFMKGIQFLGGMYTPSKKMVVLLSPQLPDATVTVGDSWRKEDALEGHYALDGTMKFLGNLVVGGRLCHIIEFSWNGTVNGKDTTEEFGINMPQDIEFAVNGKYAIDTQTRIGLFLEWTYRFPELGIPLNLQTKSMQFGIKTTSIQFGQLPAQTLELLQKGHQLLLERKLDEAETILKQAASESPDIPWLTSLSRGLSNWGLSSKNGIGDLKEYTQAPAQKELTLKIFEPVAGLPGLMMLDEEFVTKEELRQKLQEAGKVARLQIIAHQAVSLMQLDEIMELAKSAGVDRVGQVISKPGSEKPCGFDTPADTFRSLQIFIENEDWENIQECFTPETPLPPPDDEEVKTFATFLQRKYGTRIIHVEQFGDEAIVMVRMIRQKPEERVTVFLRASLREGRWFLWGAKYPPDWMPPREVLRHLGFIFDDEWMLMGPFYVPPEELEIQWHQEPFKQGELDKPQDELPENIEELLNQWVQEPFKWTLVDDGKPDAYVDLSTQWLDKETPNLGNARKQDINEEKDYWGAYAIAYIHSPDDREVELYLRGSVRCHVWYGGEWLGFGNASRNRYEFNPLDMVSGHGHIIHLKRGFNPVVVLVGRKISEDENAWGIIGRLIDLKGRPMRDLKFLQAKDYYIYPTFFKKLGY